MSGASVGETKQKEIDDFVRVANKEALDAKLQALQNLPPQDLRLQLHVRERRKIRMAIDKKIEGYWEKKNGTA